MNGVALPMVSIGVRRRVSAGKASVHAAMLHPTGDRCDRSICSSSLGCTLITLLTVLSVVCMWNSR